MSQQQHQDSHQKGMSFECYFSSIFHQEGIPVLIDPLVLRSRGCGQVDLCRIDEIGGELVIRMVEVKSNFKGLSPYQRRRLINSANWLSSVLNLPIILQTCDDVMEWDQQNKKSLRPT